MNNHLNSAELKARRQARLQRGMYLLPSCFTEANIGLGYYAITQIIAAISGDAQTHLDWAAIAILFAIPFDAIDGRIARMTNTESEFGKELDSLADVITFGVAPSLLAYVWGLHFLPDSINAQLHQHLSQAGAFICFLFLLCGASRLARFNISHDAQPRNPGRADRKYFAGMPIPAGAGLLAATVHFFNSFDCMADAGGAGGLPDGEHVAVLVGEGDQPHAPASVPIAAADCGLRLCGASLFERGVVCGRAGLYVFRDLGSCGLLVAAATAQQAS
jgi:CDP-diacylglycerol--serine O-phosphatidyltransferase